MDEFNNLPISDDNLPISNEPTSNESANIILTREKIKLEWIKKIGKKLSVFLIVRLFLKYK